MIRHHAPDELLLDYAAGVLPEGPALALALHVALDPGSRRLVHRPTPANWHGWTPGWAPWGRPGSPNATSWRP